MIRRISDLSMQVPKTTIQYDKDIIIYRQKAVNRRTRNSQDYQYSDFIPLAATLDKFSELGFVHGDINRKNIIPTSGGFYIVDLEPSLCQLKNGRKTLMITRPYVSMQDLRERCVSVRTDKIAFFFFVLRTKGWLNSTSVAKMSKDIKINEHFLPVAESAFVLFSYQKILDLAFETECPAHFLRPL